MLQWKPGTEKPFKFIERYFEAVDTENQNYTISHIQADFANGRNSQYLPAMTVKVQNRLKANELHMADLLADAGYSNGYNHEFIKLRNIMGGGRTA